MQDSGTDVGKTGGHDLQLQPSKEQQKKQTDGRVQSLPNQNDTYSGS